jgi:hypothetical protein
MLAEGHRNAAEDIEQSIKKLLPDLETGGSRVVIESAWGAAFHWIAFACETKHQQHQESHARLGRFLHNQGEKNAAERWERLDNLRQGGWYGNHADPISAQHALSILEHIRLWAMQ